MVKPIKYGSRRRIPRYIYRRAVEDVTFRGGSPQRKIWARKKVLGGGCRAFKETLKAPREYADPGDDERCKKCL